MQWIGSTAALAFAYFLGAIPFGLLVVRVCRGIDIRAHGSGNIGATNVLRVAGWRIALLVFALDAAKGYLPVLVAAGIGVWAGLGTRGAAVLPVAAAALAILGHMFPLYLGFRGGKGVATAAGALLGLDPLAMVIGLGSWGLVLTLGRIVSVASVAAAIVVPIVGALHAHEPFGADLPRVGFFVALGAMVIWRHRANIARLRAGLEPRIGRPAPTPTPAPAPEPQPEG